MRALLPLLLLLAACKCPVCPACPDMSRPPDLAAPRDLSSPPDLAACIRCDAVVNPCPALGLYCDPVARCCTSTPH